MNQPNRKHKLKPHEWSEARRLAAEELQNQGMLLKWMGDDE